MKVQLFVGVIGAAALIVALSASAQGGGNRGGDMCCGKMDTPGWSLMTPQERAEYRSKMLSFKSYEECQTYLAEHHSMMGERADQKGIVLRQTRFDACERMRERGRFN